MTEIQKAELALFSARAAGQDASLEQMKAIAICIRNRVKAGWGDGNWLAVMEESAEHLANLPSDPMRLDPGNRNLQRLAREIDDIYYGGGQHADAWIAWRAGQGGEGSLDEALKDAKYWAFVREPMQAWFIERVIHDPENHREAANMGTMLFFE